MGKYEKAWIAVDPVIFTLQGKKLKVLLLQREKEPFRGRYELPGGLLLPGETAEETRQRKIKQVLGLQDTFFTQFYTFTAPKRDPRERAVSIGFLALIPKERMHEEHLWYDLDNLPSLAFDHKEIIQKARKFLKENFNAHIARHFMPQQFPLNQLQEVYESVEEKKYDNRNFRKWIISSGIVKETAKMEENVSHRPAKLYWFKD